MAQALEAASRQGARPPLEFKARTSRPRRGAGPWGSPELAGGDPGAESLSGAQKGLVWDS